MFGRLDALLFVFVVFKDLLDVIGVPWCGWVFDAKTLASQILELSNFLGRWHRCLKVCVRMELMWLQVVPHDQGCAIDYFQVATILLHSLDGLLRSISDFKRDWSVESFKLCTASVK